MNPGNPQYILELAGLARTDLERLARLSEQLGLRTLLVQVMHEINRNLQSDPRNWGDPYTNFSELNAVGYGRTLESAGLRVAYAVHDEKPLVWLTAVRILAGSPFEAG